MKTLGYNENFSRAVLQREVPVSKLVDYLKKVVGKPEEEKQKLLEQIATEIEATYPYNEEFRSRYRK